MNGVCFDKSNCCIVVFGWLHVVCSMDSWFLYSVIPSEFFKLVIY
jgi:hypothetical protein